MKICFEKNSKEKKLTFSGTVTELLNKIGLNPEEVIVVRGEDILFMEDSLSDDDDIKILSVVSGG